MMKEHAHRINVAEVRMLRWMAVNSVYKCCKGEDAEMDVQ